jgi:hypothetical protein
MILIGETSDSIKLYLAKDIANGAISELGWFFFRPKSAVNSKEEAESYWGLRN